MTTFSTLLVERRGDVGVITMNRPEQRNAINNAMAWELGEAVAELDADGDVGAIVLTGAGASFSAGADFARFEAAAASGTHEGAVRADRPLRDWIATVRSCKPIVCAINGHAIGAGLTRTLVCDVRLASTAAVFSMRFVKIGIVPEIASTQVLAQLVGLQRAADLMLSGRTFGADEALAMGLVLEVLDPDQLMDRALELAGEYAENPPGALIETKKLLYANYVEQDVRLVTKREGEALNSRWGTPENLEALKAFREKRRPDFKGLS